MGEVNQHTSGHLRPNGLSNIHCCRQLGCFRSFSSSNTTELDIAQALVEMGVSKEDIVLGLHPPYKRPYTGYGVA